DALSHKYSMFLFVKPFILQSVANKCSQIIEFSVGEVDGGCKDRIYGRQHWLDRSNPLPQVLLYPRANRIIVPSRLEDIQMVANRIFQARERAVMEKRR